MKNLVLLRKNIDDLDMEILNLIKKRLEVAKKIGKLKKELGLKVADKKREAALLVRLTSKATKLGIDERLVKKIWRQLIKGSYKLEE